MKQMVMVDADTKVSACYFSRKNTARPRGLRKQIVGLLGLGLITIAALSPISSARAQLAASKAPVTFADIVEKVKPAVVSIRVSSGGIERSSQNKNNSRRRAPFPELSPDHPLNEFFKNRRPRGDREQRRRRGRSQGSGFIISADGFVVTNHHVIRNGNQITVSFDEKTKYQAELVGSDARTDLALLKIKSNKKFPYVKFATEKSRVGDWVVAVGNPFGLGGTVTAGILSAQGRDIGSGPYDFIQVDAAVNRGNSGGPTFNLKGEVIGVNTAIYSPSGGNVGIAFAVPAKTATEIIEELKKNGTISRGWLGVRIQDISEDMAASLGLSEPQGALISGVNSDGPAQKAGLRSGDAILKVNGSKIEDSRDLARKVAEFTPGNTVKVAIRRAGERNLTINVKLGSFPNSKNSKTEVKPAKSPKATALVDLGLELETNRCGKKGVIVSKVEDISDAAEKGVQRGDIILQINSQDVSKIADVNKVIKAAKTRGRKAVMIKIKRGDAEIFIALQLKKA